jgi:hypothetical protein
MSFVIVLIFLQSPYRSSVDPNCHRSYSFWHCPKKKQKTLARLNLSARESQNFRPSRKGMTVAHFGFPPSAGPESGQGLRAFHIENFF